MVALLALAPSAAAASVATVALLTAVVVALGLGLGVDDDVHPAIITVAPAITTSTKMRCFFMVSLSLTDSLGAVLDCFGIYCSFNEVYPLNRRSVYSPKKDCCLLVLNVLKEKGAGGAE